MTKNNKKDAQVIALNDVVTNVTLLNLVQEVAALKSKHKKTCEMAVRAILHALDFKDHYTFGHSMRVAFYSLALGKELGLPEDELYDLELAALFHDIGKIGVPDSVLLKPSRLSETEFDIMKSHPVKSAEILQGFEDFEKIAKYARHHHERFDGKGYPEGLQGEDIPLFSRIILIADTFDAMTSSRPYRKGLPYETAYEELREFSSTQFDPNLVEYFVKAMEVESKTETDIFKLSIIDGEFKKEAA